MRLAIRLGSMFLFAAVAAAPMAGAQTAADTAAVILNTARRLEREGRPEVARELLRFLQQRYLGTPAATEAQSLLSSLPRVMTGGTGRTGFVLFNTIYGGFLGVAIPAALNASGSEPFGAGLLLGVPLGYFGSRAFSKSRFTSPGQAGIASFATTWGTWQGLALQQAAGFGDQEFCDTFGCFRSESDTAPWVAQVVGGVAGLATGWALAASREIPAGTSTLISHSAFWGTWFGLSLGVVSDLHDKDLFWSMIAAGNAGLLLAIPAASKWRPPASRVRLITAGGVAGGLVGFGIDLLANVDGEGAALGIPAVSSALGLIIGAVATGNRRGLEGNASAAPASGALVDATEGLKVNLPMPQPALFRVLNHKGDWISRPGMRVILFQGRL